MTHGLNILLIDDNPDDAIIFQRAFAKTPSKVQLHLACSGLEALDYIRGVDRFANRALYPLPALLVLDLNMPGIDGFNVIQWVRKESQLREIPIVVLSSSTHAKDISRAHRLGANAYHVKPNDVNALVGMVEGLKTYWVDQKLHPGHLASGDAGRITSP
jgi:CheY-like chemotaxis protein